MIEQMCGADGPGTPSWDRHVDELKGARRKLADAYEPFRRPLGKLRSAIQVNSSLVKSVKRLIRSSGTVKVVLRAGPLRPFRSKVAITLIVNLYRLHEKVLECVTICVSFVRKEARPARR